MNIKDCALFIVISIILFILFIISIIYIVKTPSGSKTVYYDGNDLNDLFNIDYNDTIAKKVNIRKNNGETCTIDTLYQAKKPASENGQGEDIPESMKQTFVGDCEPLKDVVSGEGIEWLDKTKFPNIADERKKHIVRMKKRKIVRKSKRS